MAAQAIAWKFTDSRNNQEVRAFSQQALRRAELIVDFAFISLGNVVEQGVVNCSQSSRTIIRRQVLSRATIKDTRLLLGVDWGQGYLVSPPVPAGKFLDLLDRNEFTRETTNRTLAA